MRSPKKRIARRPIARSWGPAAGIATPRLLSFLRRFYYHTATSNFLQFRNLQTLVGLNQNIERGNMVRLIPQSNRS